MCLCVCGTSYWLEEDGIVVLPCTQCKPGTVVLIEFQWHIHNKNTQSKKQLSCCCSSGPYAIIRLYLCGNDKSRRKRQWEAGTLRMAGESRRSNKAALAEGGRGGKTTCWPDVCGGNKYVNGIICVCDWLGECADVCPCVCGACWSQVNWIYLNFS